MYARFAWLRLLPMVAVIACAAEPDYGADPLEPVDPGPPDWPRGLHVVGSDIQDSAGQVIRLHGVNRSGSEYRCVQENGFFDGSFDDTSVRAIRSWPNVNSVRVPLNESCWLGINGVSEALGGDNYKTAMKNYVARLHKHDLIPIIELHWVGPGTERATGLQPMPDADHALAFWTDVATTFLDDDGVVFEPFNEPFPDNNRDSNAAWACWRDGCAATLYGSNAMGQRSAIGMYQAVGMQGIVDAIRATGSTHVILLGGVRYSNALTQWLAHKPNDPLNQLGAAWHLYNFNACVSPTCWDVAPAAVAASVPLVATEIGQDDCVGSFITPLMTWLDAHGDGYLAWSWNAFGPCEPATSPGRGGRPWSLITNYLTGAPNGAYAQTFRDHIAAR
jgi:endoglucanase